ncbi:MAG: hypothetical protein M1816_006469 [Peltula sp. TS41687]|nr:MAG: hypothetical protein M1816_006469 [Peltula sp. TS41687]
MNRSFALALLFPLMAIAHYGFTVDTANGPVVGHRAVNRSQVTEYLGIPYAKPPVGSLRFEAPQKYTGNQRLVASNTCPQTPSKPVAYPDATPQELRIIANFLSQTNHTQSEDCLTLNIWSKQTRRRAKPVLIFFHGGRWSIGESNSPFYNGQYLADAEDIVVVTLNYRINIFGFPGAPDAPKNVGLLDQRLAVEWVRDNIRAFGGDPKRMVIWGHSVGGSSVDFWSFSYLQDPIITGLISDSGNAFSFPINSKELAERNWYNASARLGCGSSGDVMPCMRSKPFTEISAAAAGVRPPPAISQARSQPVFQSTVDNQTVFSASEYPRLASEGKFARLPYLVGNDENEAGYYKIPVFGQGVSLSDAAWDAFNLEAFTCPSTFEANNRAKQDVPVWLYRYFGDWDNLRLYPNSSTYHGSELNMIFGGSEDVSGLPDSVPERQTKALMMHAWATFVNDPKRGLTKLGWPKFDPEGMLFLTSK